MYIPRAEFCDFVAFMVGYDLASEGSALCGFNEWLVSKTGKPANWAWESLVLTHAGLDRDPTSPRTPQQEANAIESLFSLLAQFLPEHH